MDFFGQRLIDCKQNVVGGWVLVARRGIRDKVPEYLLTLSTYLL